MHVLRALLSRLGRRPRRDGRAGVSTDGVVVSGTTSPPEQVEAYWTDERIRGAVPRERRLDPPQR